MKRAKILIVEDERTIAEDLKLTLENLGYKVTGTVSSSADAFYEIIREDLPELTEFPFRNLVDLIPDLIAILDTDHKIIRANEAMARALGCTKDEAIGQPCYKIVHGLGAIPEFCPHTRTMLSKSEERSEVEEPRLNGIYDVTTTPIFNEHGIVTGSVHVARDISLRKQREHLITENVALGEFALTHSMNELVTYTIDKAEQLTNSKIGFFHFLDEKSTVTLQGWSTHTREKFCSANAAINHYPLKEAGVWADCIREVRPVIHNDYANLLQKKGMPEGHAVLERELTLPIVRADQVVAVIGVGNKSVDYTESDVECLRQLSNHAWEYIINKRIEGTLHKKITELELLNRLMVDRELKMIELKQEVNLLSNKMGEGDRYVVHSK